MVHKCYPAEPAIGFAALWKWPIHLSSQRKRPSRFCNTELNQFERMDESHDEFSRGRPVLVHEFKCRQSLKEVFPRRYPSSLTNAKSSEKEKARADARAFVLKCYRLLPSQ